MRLLRFSARFKKDVKLCQKQGKNIEKLHDVFEILASGEPVPDCYHDHPLSGEYKGCRDLHIEPDWVLIYKEMGNTIVIMLTTGSHAKLFK